MLRICVIRLCSGDALFVGARGTDLFVYAKADGNLYIKDTSNTPTTPSTLVLDDLTSADVSFTRLGDQLMIHVTATGKVVTVDSFFQNWGDGDPGIDALQFADGATWNRDQIRAKSVFAGYPSGVAIQDSAGVNTFHPGVGNFEIDVGTGNDTILYSKGDGWEWIHDATGATNLTDVLSFTDLGPDDVQLSRTGDALRIKVLSTGEVITDDRFFLGDMATGSSYGLEAIRFASGVQWDRAQIQRMAWYRGSPDQPQSILTSALNDTIDCGKADQILLNGGVDTILWSPGDGDTTIAQQWSGDPAHQSHDSTLKLDFAIEDAGFVYQGNDLVIADKATGEIIRVSNFFDNAQNLQTDAATTSHAVANIEFSDASVDRHGAFQRTGMEYLGKQYAFSALVFRNTDGTSTVSWAYATDEFGHNYLVYGTPPVECPQRLFASDFEFLGFRVNGASTDASGVIVLPGDIRAGDTVAGIPGGNNIMTGGGGDTFTVTGAGDNVLSAGNLWSSQANVLDASQSTGNNILATGGSNDTVYGGSGDDQIQVGGGAVYAGAGNDNIGFYSGVQGSGYATIDAGPGDDTITYAGHATYRYARGDGNDTYIRGLLTTGAGSQLLAFTDINADDISITADDATIPVLYIAIEDTGQKLTFVGDLSTGFDVQFANGDHWDRAKVLDETTYTGTSAPDFINAGSDNGTAVDGGLQDDTILFGGGNHRFIYRSGDGNDVYQRGSFGYGPQVETLDLVDLNPSDVRVSRDQQNLFITDQKTGQRITWTAWQVDGFPVVAIDFADGTKWNAAQVHQAAWYLGTNTADYIVGIAEGATIDAGLGDDTVAFRDGGLTFMYARGDGNDTYQAGGYWREYLETLNLKNENFNDIYLNEIGRSLIITDLSTAETIEFTIWDKGGDYPIQIKFADGTSMSNADILYWVTQGNYSYVDTAWNDTIKGSYRSQSLTAGPGNAFIDGGGGSDSLFGGRGSDTFSISIANPGDIDHVTGFVGSGGSNTLTFADFDAAVSVDLILNDGDAKTSDAASLATGSLRTIAKIVGVHNVTGSAFDDFMVPRCFMWVGGGLLVLIWAF